MVTVIVGETDQGKSALLRALDAVCYNALEGSSFVRDGCDKACITVFTAEGDRVTLEKGPQVNLYRLNDKTFDKIGRSVPEAVQKALGIAELTVDSDSLKLQLQPQLEAPFLVTDQGVRATRFLGSVSKVAVIYQAVKLATVKKKDAIISLSTLQLLFSEIKEKVASYDYLEGLGPEIAQLSSYEVRLENIEQERSALSNLQDKFKELQTLESGLVKQEDLLTEIKNHLNKEFNILQETDRLLRLASLFDKLRQRKEALDFEISAAEARAELLLKLARFHERWALIQTEASVLMRFQNLTEAGQDMTTAISIAEHKRQILKAQVNTLENELACPTCGRLPVSEL